MQKQFKAWTEASKDTHQDHHVYFKLHESKDNVLILTCCDKEGTPVDGGNILAIDGNLNLVVLMEGVDNTIPLKTDARDSVLVYNTSEIRDILHPYPPVIRISASDLLEGIDEGSSGSSTKTLN